MNGIELKIPIRLYWDLSPAPAGPVPDYAAVCRDILDLKVLSINLLDLHSELSDATLRILAFLKGKAAVALTISPEAFDRLSSDTLEQLGMRTLFVYFKSLERMRSVPFSRMTGSSVGVSFDVTTANWHELTEVVHYCAEQGIKLLSLPMQRLINQRNAFFLCAEEKSTLSSALHSVPLPPLKFTIHDPFLWKIFFPTISFPDGGCQAGNTMIYISPEGDVYPCPSLPVRIGSLSARSLREIVLSAEKAEIRSCILDIPTRCADCVEMLHCKGGCRGRACAYHGILDSTDPGCLV